MWAGEFFLAVRTVMEGEVEEQRRMMRLVAYSNYHLLASKGAEVGTFLSFLRNAGLTDEIRLSPEEIARDKAMMGRDIELIVEHRLAEAEKLMEKMYESGPVPDSRRSGSGGGPGDSESPPVPTPM